MEWLKPVHISCVALSFLGFFVRGFWVLSDSPMHNKKWVKTVPHIIDTLLLLSALLMLYVSGWSVFDMPWLQAKIVALLLYIILGMIALKYATTRLVQACAWGAGLVVFLYIVSVAVTKSSFGFVVWLS